MTGTDVAIVLTQEAERALVFWKNNPMLPASYIKAGIVQWDDMRRAAWLLTWLDLDVAASLGDTFVIKDTVGLKADLQRTLLGRVPGYAIDFPEIEDDHVTGRIHTPNGGWSSPLTKRLTRLYPIPQNDPDRGWRGDRDMVTYAKANEKNYGDKPNRMLIARTTTLLIDIYAKGIIRGLVHAQAGDRGAAIYTDVDELAPPVVAAANAHLALPAQELPPRSVAPDGSTIPEPLREPAVDDDTRAQLAYRIEALQPAPRADLAAVCKDLKLPNLRTNRFTRAHGALLGRLIAETVDRHGTGEIVERLDTLIGQIVDEQVPDAVYDDAPESSDSEPGAERYDPDDPTRPFA